MMFNIAPLILILFSLGVIIVIVLRKFAVLANLDVDSIPAEREARVKERIITSRLQRTYFKYFSRISRTLGPVREWLGKFFQETYSQLVEARDNYKKEEGQSTGAGVVDKLLVDAADLTRAEKWEEAEKKYIEIIGIDSTNTKAFKELGQVYYQRKDYNEAKQTIKHALRLLEKALFGSPVNGENEAEKEADNLRLAELYFDLTLANKSLELYDEALRSINNALKLGRNNPRYLDTKIEISIISKDKISALDAWEKLSETNPENKKLPELKKLIDQL